MKKIFFSVSFILISFYSISQDYKVKLEKQFLEYFDAVRNKDFNKSMEYMNEDFFALVPKSQLIKVLETTFNNPDISFTIDSAKILRIDSIKMIDKVSYVKMKYASSIQMKFNDVALTSDSVSADDKIATRSILTAAIEKQFGVENVKYNDTTQYYRIYSVKEVIANSKDAQNWKFVVIEEKQRVLLEKFIPKELL